MTNTYTMISESSDKERDVSYWPVYPSEHDLRKDEEAPYLIHGLPLPTLAEAFCSSVPLTKRSPVPTDYNSFDQLFPSTELPHKTAVTYSLASCPDNSSTAETPPYVKIQANILADEPFASPYRDLGPRDGLALYDDPAGDHLHDNHRVSLLAQEPESLSNHLAEDLLPKAEVPWDYSFDTGSRDARNLMDTTSLTTWSGPEAYQAHLSPFK
ncbi:uncharacterized protein BP01DRAFT_389586 [Aspergillus saccharolyticus JOP 1030-1]|uniref:Uncharacterized protein n=1 Tax=Aspergillus saccharolyticus JOP 1030-1 TaxID=1450539 RepID=A0A318ZLP7_9EURO|nr:hypothetical protein BP01DRAFT_389586 [Aspergillus saccharolyticus JOP 1030-1]PYH47665.1 hypothetical protein BP01DRAFT_389586 [Aspergillus saccharolyticus JOP 1030-1]